VNRQPTGRRSLPWLMKNPFIQFAKLLLALAPAMMVSCSKPAADGLKHGTDDVVAEGG